MELNIGNVLGLVLQTTSCLTPLTPLGKGGKDIKDGFPSP